MSTPDIKNLEQHESSSPYMSLEVIGNSDIEDDTISDISDTDTDIANDKSRSDSYSTSDSELEYERPKRPSKSSKRLPSNIRVCKTQSHHVSEENGFSNNHSVYVSKHKEAMMKTIQPQGFDRE